MKKFWNLKNENGKAELYIYGEIEAVQFWGDEITPQTIQQQLEGCSGQLDVYINSGGGDVFAGQTIYNLIKRYNGTVTVHIDGLAASIASVIAMAGDRIVMPENAMMMIHNAWAISAGNAGEHRRMADELDRVDVLIRDVYAARSKREPQAIADYMAAETWFTASEALEVGLIDEIEANKAIAASINGDILTINGEQVDMSRYQHPPRAAVQAVEIVYGAPCSGKSTYVREQALEGDLFYDYDALVRAMTTEDKRGTEKTVAHEVAIGVRGLMINKLATEKCRAKRAYIITRWPTDNLREQLEGMSVVEHRMETTRDECLSRLEDDDTRTDKAEWADIINRWFDEHDLDKPDEPDNGGEGQPVEDSNQALNDQRRQFQALRRKILDTTD
ncbi:MAG: ATP-dependent Clp protease proteolytic subunit [Clostridia bacterium]|nr:ATP-dependent Clp protease proteolytic subunit [Clostridia bacterium]